MSVSGTNRDEMTIGQVARRFRITLQTLYFYEDEGLIRPRRENGRRVFDAALIDRIAFILDKKKEGLSLALIGTMLSELCAIVAVACTGLFTLAELALPV